MIYVLQRFMIDFHKGNFKSEQLFFFVYEHTLSSTLSADQSLVHYKKYIWKITSH